MSMSGGVMSNVALDAALAKLGMLSSSILNSPEVVAEQTARLAALDLLEDNEAGFQNKIRIRKRCYSTSDGRHVTLSRSRPYKCVSALGAMWKHKDIQKHSMDLERPKEHSMDHSPHCSLHEQSNLDPAQCIAFPIESVSPSTLFKSRSMESIEARTSDESVSASEFKDLLLNTNLSLGEVDSVSSGLNRLNVSE